MNKQKTYTVEELKQLKSRYLYGVDDINWSTDDFIDWLSSQSTVEQCKLCHGIGEHGDGCPKKQYKLEEIKGFIIVTIGSDLASPSSVEIVQKLNELIWSHNTLLKQMRGKA